MSVCISHEILWRQVPKKFLIIRIGCAQSNNYLGDYIGKLGLGEKLGITGNNFRNVIVPRENDSRLKNL